MGEVTVWLRRALGEVRVLWWVFFFFGSGRYIWLFECWGVVFTCSNPDVRAAASTQTYGIAILQLRYFRLAGLVYVSYVRPLIIRHKAIAKAIVFISNLSKEKRRTGTTSPPIHSTTFKKPPSDPISFKLNPAPPSPKAQPHYPHVSRATHSPD